MVSSRRAARTVGDVLAVRRRRAFVGRQAELELVQAALDAAEPPFSVLWFTGPGGIGKTTLLDVVADQATEGGSYVVRLDGRDVSGSPQAVLEALGEALGMPVVDQRVAARRGRLVVLIDAYERLSGLDDWLRTWLLPRMPLSSLTVVAGRDGPGSAWRADAGWRDRLRAVALRNLDQDASRSYLQRCGVDEAMQDRLVEITHGHPLALSLLADVVVRGGEVSLSALDPDLVGTLVQRFVEVVPVGPQRRALEVCALARVTTEPLLRDTLGVDDASKIFAWLRDLSFVESGPDGVFPHDLARDVLDADLRWRDTEGYKDVFRRVREHISSMLTSTRGREQQRAVFDLKFVFRNLPSVLSPVDWDAWGRHYPEPASAQDAARVIELVAAVEGEESAAIAERWIELQPEGFLVIREDGDVRGLLALLDLSKVSDDDRRADPGAEAAWEYAHRQAPPRPGEVITQTRFLVDRDTYQQPSPTLNAIAVVTLQEYLAIPRLAWDFVTLHEPEPWDEFFALADLPRAVGADFVVGGRRYGLFAHDFRRVGVAALMELWTERALAQDPALRPATPTADALVLSQTEYSDAVRQALRELHDPALLSHSPLLRTRAVRDLASVDDPDAESLARVLRMAVEVLGQHPRDDKLRRAVELTYLRPAPNQEAVAEVLGLPFSTYRRHLTQGVARLVARLWEQEIYGTSSGSSDQH